MKIFLIIMAVIIAFVGALSVYSKWSNSRPFFASNYYEKFTTLCPLEDRYSRKGSYDVESIQYSSDDKKIAGIIKNSNLEQALNQLVKKVLDRKGKDNITAMLAKIL